MPTKFAGTITQLLCADGGSDINLMPNSLLSSLATQGADRKITNFQHPRSFVLGTKTSASKDPIDIKCDKMVVLSIGFRCDVGNTSL